MPCGWECSSRTSHQASAPTMTCSRRTGSPRRLERYVGISESLGKLAEVDLEDLYSKTESALAAGVKMGNVPNLLKLSKASPSLRRRFARDEQSRCRMGRKNIYGCSSSQLPHLSAYCDGEIWENARGETAFALPKSVLSPTDISHGVYA